VLRPRGSAGIERPQLDPEVARIVKWSATSLAALLLVLHGILPDAHAQRLSPKRTPERIAIQTRSESNLPSSVQQKIESFLQSLIKGQTQSAYFNLLDGTSMGTQKEAIDRFVEATRESASNYGSYASYEFVETRQPTENLLLPSYMTFQENKILRWQFVFFRPTGSKWVLANIKVDDWRNYLALAPSPQAEPPPDLVRGAIREFFVLLQSDRIDDAFARLLDKSPLTKKPDAMNQFLQRTKNALSEYGLIRQYELYDRSKLGKRIVLLTYIAYVDSEPLRWQFYYDTQLNDGRWTLINVRVDDLLDEALLEL
jgi:hypothetical protein